MRKVILLTAFIAVAVGLKAQNDPFPDGGFENNWEKYENPVQGKASYWDFKDNYLLSTLNPFYELSGDMGDAPLTAFREEGGDVYNGNYSLKVVSDQMTFGGTSIFLPGVAATLYINFNPVDCILGQPFTSRPTAIKGFHKYIPVNGDSAAIDVRLKKNGVVLGSGKQVIYSEVSTWTQFDIPINYVSNETPDTIVVIFASSANYDFTSLATLLACQGQIGSALYLDDIEFDYTQAENITDGGFENCWVTKQGTSGTYEDFNDNYYFNSLNIFSNLLSALGGTADLTAFKDSVDVLEGKYALKLVSGNLQVMGNTLFLPGAMGNITLQPVAGMPPISLTLGHPFTSRPVAIKGWHKYIPVDGDSAAIEISLKKNGTIIGSGKQIITSKISSWSQFSVPVNYTSANKPDTIIIIFSASAKYDFTDLTTLMQCDGQVGSALYLDDLELDYVWGSSNLTVTVLTNDGTKGIVEGGGTYAANSTATIKAMPYQGYRFIQWTDGNYQNPRTFTVTQDTTFTAVFDIAPQRMYHVSASANDTNMGIVTGSGDYSADSTAIISAIANQGYHFVQWNDGNRQNSRTITVTQDTVFMAIFSDVPQNTYRITVLSSDLSRGTVMGSGDYIVNSTVNIAAIPHQGYYFVKWDDGSPLNPRTITVTQDHTFIATFDVINSITEIETSTPVIYPNPATDNIYIILPENVHQAFFTIYDIQGKALIHKEINNRDAVSVTNLATGIYIYNVTTEKQKHKGQLIIDR
ncbi:MAG: PCMD domain-containing protein [Bacteroidales bacterium]|jgi:hypothetical protein|nr:PCMD domain-containing protein [Bacteroidales bacterium]